MRKLLSSVEENGFIYIYYLLAERENVYINYPKNSYFRKVKMKNYFDNPWEILNIKENNLPVLDVPHLYNDIKHNHLIGVVLVKKKYLKRVHKYYYKISIA